MHHYFAPQVCQPSFPRVYVNQRMVWTYVLMIPVHHNTMWLICACVVNQMVQSYGRKSNGHRVLYCTFVSIRKYVLCGFIERCHTKHSVCIGSSTCTVCCAHHSRESLPFSFELKFSPSSDHSKGRTDNKLKLCVTL